MVETGNKDDTPRKASRAESELADTWRASVEAWRDTIASSIPPDGRVYLQRAVDQGNAFLQLADGISKKPSGDSRGDALWRQPLELWQQAAARMLAARARNDTAGAAPDAATDAYQQALLEYTSALHDVGAKTLADVSEAWRESRSPGQAPAGLRELFDLYVKFGERRYHELVSGPAFAELSGRLINSLVDWVLNAQTDSSSAATDAAPKAALFDNADGAIPDLSGLFRELGLGLEQTTAELQAFGEKLNVGIATLKQLGPIEVGASDREIVHQDGKLRLYRYSPTTEITNPVPVLIVYALANRPYMMDLQPQRSLLRGLMDQGLEVYLIDWGYPDEGDRQLGLDDYVNGLIDDCVEVLRRRHGLDRVNLLGVCQGGTFSLCYGALNPDKLRNLVLMVTPVDFHTPDNLLTAWLRHVDVDRMVNALGNVPGELLNWAFVSMKPLRLTGQKYLDMLDLLDDEEKTRTFLRMEKWIHDSPAQAGECFRQFVKDFFQRNKLVEGGLRIGDRCVDLQAITMPVLNVYAAHDHIVPPAASLALEGLIATTDYTAREFEGGHIGIYVSSRAQREVPRTIAEWLHARCQAEASL